MEARCKRSQPKARLHLGNYHIRVLFSAVDVQELTAELTHLSIDQEFKARRNCSAGQNWNFTRHLFRLNRVLNRQLRLSNGSKVKIFAWHPLSVSLGTTVT